MPEFFERILSGDKKFELRLGDFECEEGDLLVLREWDSLAQEFTGRSLEKTVTYVLKTNDVTFWPQEDVDKYGFQIISFN